MFPSPIIAQNILCGTTMDEEESFQKVITQPLSTASCSFTTERGLYLPSTDTLRVRIIFAKFQDDTDNISYWPQSGFPTFASNYIDSSATVGSTHRFNLTNYYRTFSQDQFIVIGKADTVTLNQSMFHTSYVGVTKFDYESKTFNANKAALQQLESRPGFELYDNWTKATHNH